MLYSLASIVILISTAWFVTVPESTAVNKRTLTLSYMVDTENYGKKNNIAITKERSIFDLSLQSAPTELLGLDGLRLGLSAMYDIQGSYLFGPGMGKTITYDNYNFTLFIYPSYSSIHGLDRESISGRLNWRTTIDATYHFSDTLRIGIGIMHISNGGYKDPNNGIEALRMAFERDL